MDKPPQEEKLSPLEGVFYWWGRLTADQSKIKGSFPFKASQFLAFIAPKVRAMGFGMDNQAKLMSAFLKGIYKIFWREASKDLDDE